MRLILFILKKWKTIG